MTVIAFLVYGCCLPPSATFVVGLSRSDPLGRGIHKSLTNQGRSLPSVVQGEEGPCDGSISRRSILQNASKVSLAAACLAVLSCVGGEGAAAYAAATDLKFETAASGLQWADAKIGTGQALSKGSSATIDFVLSTTGARYGTKIYATNDKDLPYRWTLGDGSTIAGIEEAILGGSGIPPLLPGGIRRLVIPQSMGYQALAASGGKDLCVQDGKPGPIPPPNSAFEEYQRFKNIYCNPERQYQPDIVMDIKLYGARSLR